MAARSTGTGIGRERQKFYFQFITTPTSDTLGTSLILHFDNQRYLFGQVAEGTQRACIERGVGLKKVHNIFLTGSTTWRNNGGLIGLILTMSATQEGAVHVAEEGRQRLNIYGGPKLLHTMACARRFIFRTGMPLSIYEPAIRDEDFPMELVCDDENIKVWSLPISTSDPGQPTSGNAEDIRDPAERSPIAQKRLSNGSEKYEQAQKIRKDVVTDMFDSDWQRDRLVETAFKDVRFPATIWLRNPDTKQLESHHCLNMDSLPDMLPDTMVQIRNPWPAATVGELPEANDLRGDVSMSYIVKGQPQRGAFDPKRAAALGIEPGPNFGKLTSGHSVKAKDGSTVTPEMVLGAPKPGRGIAIFDLPSRHCVSNLKDRLRYIDKDIMDGIETMLWMVSSSTEIGEDFICLLDSIKGVKHIVSCPVQDYLGLDSSAMTSARLGRILPQTYPALCYNNEINLDLILGSNKHLGRVEQNSLFFGDVPLERAQRGLKIEVEPNFSISKDEIPPLTELDYSPKLIIPEVSHLMPSELPTPATSFSENLRQSDDLVDPDEPEIITLGTGSAAPSKYRNVSATLLRMPHGIGNYLFDCGENTAGQLKRIYTGSQYKQLLSNLHAIWISHLHADHHLGTLTILREWSEVRRENLSGGEESSKRDLHVMSEVNMMDFLSDYRSVEDYLSPGAGIWPIVCHPVAGVTLYNEPFDFGRHNLLIRKVETARVSHCHGAQAVAMTFQNGFKISYSGDCRPSFRFTQIGAKSDVLIHEATFDDGMEGDAQAKKHCTTGEALGVALKMEAKNVVLTHFSQRYQKVPVLNNVKLPDEVLFEDGNQGEGSAMQTVDEVLETEELNVQIADGDHDKTVVISTDTDSFGGLGSEETPLTAEQKDRALLDQLEDSGDDGRRAAKMKAAREMNICVAFDYMRVKVSQIKEMKPFYPAIEKMFEIEHDRAEAERLAVANAQKEKNLERKQKLQKQQQQRREKAQLSPATRTGESHLSSKAAADEAKPAQNVMSRTPPKTSTKSEAAIPDEQSTSKNQLKRMVKEERKEKRKAARRTQLTAYDDDEASRRTQHSTEHNFLQKEEEEEDPTNLQEGDEENTNQRKRVKLD